jgi:hypothetical protein
VRPLSCQVAPSRLHWAPAAHAADGFEHHLERSRSRPGVPRLEQHAIAHRVALAQGIERGVLRSGGMPPPCLACVHVGRTVVTNAKGGVVSMRARPSLKATPGSAPGCRECCPSNRLCSIRCDPVLPFRRSPSPGDPGGLYGAATRGRYRSCSDPRRPNIRRGRRRTTRAVLSLRRAPGRPATNPSGVEAVELDRLVGGPNRYEGAFDEQRNEL